MSMKQQISAVCKSLYFQMRKISSIRDYLTEEVTQKLVTSLILSKLDYCNALLAGLPQKTLHPLQLAQNNAARLIFRSRKRDHVTPLLRELHWLPVNERIIFKVCVYCYKCINNIAPVYLSNTIHLYKPTRTGLRSEMDETILVKPKSSYKYFGQRSFSYYGPLVWNELPKKIREACSLPVFKKLLKHHLFVRAYEC